MALTWLDVCEMLRKGSAGRDLLTLSIRNLGKVYEEEWRKLREGFLGGCSDACPAPHKYTHFKFAFIYATANFESLMRNLAFWTALGFLNGMFHKGLLPQKIRKRLPTINCGDYYLELMKRLNSVTVQHVRSIEEVVRYLGIKPDEYWKLLATRTHMEPQEVRKRFDLLFLSRNNILHYNNYVTPDLFMRSQPEDLDDAMQSYTNAVLYLEKVAMETIATSISIIETTSKLSIAQIEDRSKL